MAKMMKVLSNRMRTISSWLKLDFLMLVPHRIFTDSELPSKPRRPNTI